MTPVNDETNYRSLQPAYPPPSSPTYIFCVVPLCFTTVTFSRAPSHPATPPRPSTDQAERRPNRNGQRTPQLGRSPTFVLCIDDYWEDHTVRPNTAREVLTIKQLAVFGHTVWSSR
jgi:hypothetical protein